MTGPASISSLTVVIPTYNRRDALRKALLGYVGQSDPHLIGELIVVDDGSTDDTRSVVAECQQKAPFEIRYLNQSNRGPAAARNLGLANAARPIVLYTDDDIIPAPNLVAQHVEWHRRNPDCNVAVLGYVTWSLEVRATPFMKWYGEGGTLFAYRQFRDQREIDSRFLYSCNLSLQREFLQAGGGFDEHFKTAAYEDTELGYRLAKSGLRLLYNPQAVAYHHQYFTFAGACKKKMQAQAAWQCFLRTEAGQRFLERERQRHATLGFRVAKRAAMMLGKILDPNAKVLDSHLPLPGAVYRGLLWYHAGRLLQSSALHENTADGEPLALGD